MVILNERLSFCRLRRQTALAIAIQTNTRYPHHLAIWVTSLVRHPVTKLREAIRGVWSWDPADFGETNANQKLSSTTFSYNQRFPGQYYDGATLKNYNYFRDYDPAVGRYLESDPIGLNGGLNSYAYADGNPSTFFDPDGTEVIQNNPGFNTSQACYVSCVVGLVGGGLYVGSQIAAVGAGLSAAGGAQGVVGSIIGVGCDLSSSPAATLVVLGGKSSLCSSACGLNTDPIATIVAPIIAPFFAAS